MTWSGGKGHAAGDPDLRLYATLLYELIHDCDGQQRPVTPSSGLHWEKGEPELRREPLPADYLEYHSYEMTNRRRNVAALNERDNTL